MGTFYDPWWLLGFRGWKPLSFWDRHKNPNFLQSTPFQTPLMMDPLVIWRSELENNKINHQFNTVGKTSCLCRRTFYRPTNWGRVGWAGVGWGVISFVSTARHDAMLRYAWGGVGCDIIRHYCKTWCDSTLCMGWGWLWYHSSVLQDMMWC